MDEPNVLKGRLTFLQASEALKNTLRSGYTSEGRPESTAEHTWRLCLLALIFEDKLPNVDMLKLLKLCIVHDLGEAIRGDIPAVEQVDKAAKQSQEREDIRLLTTSLDAALRRHVLALWEEYEEGATLEAGLAKAFDKLETLMQHNQGKNPSNFDYAFNLAYGLHYTQAHPVTAAVREILDRDTRARMAKGS